MTGFIEWAKNIVCFSIFATLIKNLLPSQKYTPYVQIYIGFMMLLVFLTPVLKFFRADKTMDYLTDILNDTFMMKEDSFLASLNENSNYENTKKEYIERIEQSMTDYLKNSFTTEEDYVVERTEIEWDEQAGQMTQVVVYLKKGGEEQTEENKIQIRDIAVEVFSGAKRESSLEEQKESNRIKDLLEKVYPIKEDSVHVEVRIAEEGAGYE